MAGGKAHDLGHACRTRFKQRGRRGQAAQQPVRRLSRETPLPDSAFPAPPLNSCVGGALTHAVMPANAVVLSSAAPLPGSRLQRTAKGVSWPLSVFTIHHRTRDACGDGRAGELRRWEAAGPGIPYRPCDGCGSAGAASIPGRPPGTYITQNPWMQDGCIGGTSQELSRRQPRKKILAGFSPQTQEKAPPAYSARQSWVKG